MKYTLNEIEFKSIREMPLNDRPREKLLATGAESLTDTELLCVLLGKGRKGLPVQDLADRILGLEKVDRDSLAEVEGLGGAGRAAICAALELGRRLGGGLKRRVRCGNDVFDCIRHYGDRSQEHFLCIIVNGALEVIHTHVVSVGLVNRTLVHPREVFMECIKRMGTAVILAHNHPSGNLEPSQDDIDLTSRLRKAGGILGIEVMDHFIFSDQDYYSMRESGEFWA